MADAIHRVGIVLLATSLLVCVIVAPRTVGAQSPQPAPWMQLTIVQVDPPMVDEYVAAQRDVTARVRRGGPPWRIVSRTDVFGDNYRFLIATPVQNLGSFDARNADPELTALNNRAQKYVKSQQSYAIRTIPEIDNPLPEKQQPELILINIAKVVPGREQDYLNLMKSDFLPHFNKATFFHQSGTLTFGGEAAFIHLFYARNFAKLDEGSPVVKALGPAGAQAVTAKLSGIVTSSEQWVARVVPDLSFGPWSPAPATRP